MTGSLTISGLRASIGGLEILKGIDLDVPYGEIHALMGPNGSGKSTLCHVLLGKADYVAQGSAVVAGTEVLGLPVDQRARAGLFGAFQYPVEIPGLTLDDLVAEMRELAAEEPDEFAARVEEVSALLRMDPFRKRAVNSGLSGGEKKRSEVYQLLVARPRFAVLDEIDSGLDIDAVREIAGLVESLRSVDRGVLIITHYSRILRYMSVDRVHVMIDGRIVRSGGPEVAEELEAKGYAEFRTGLGLEEHAPEPDPFADLP